jgi:hypothetical protein
VRIRVVGFIVVISAFFAGAGAGAAGAATVTGSLQVMSITPTSVTFNVTAQRTCAPDEQCDYYADLEELDGTGDCPTTYPADPWNAWNGNVQNTGPTTEVGTITPRRWTGTAPVAPERLCLFIFADNVYYGVGGVTIARPDAPPTTTGTSTPPGGTTTPPGVRPGGGTTPGTGRTPARTTPRVATVALTKAATSAKAALKRKYGKRFTQGKRYKAKCTRVSKTHVRCAVSWQNGGTWKGTVDVTGAVRSGRQVLVTRIRVRRPKR